MEFLYLIGFFGLLIIISWIIKKVGEFLEERKYKIKLDKLTPKIGGIDKNELVSKLSDLKETYSSLKDLLDRNYNIRNEDGQAKSIYEYVKEEANYRRKKRKPRKRTSGRKYRRYY
jgi:hypothetical protein